MTAVVPGCRLRSIVVDCDQPAELARFWAAALGYTVRPYDQAEIDRLQAAGYTPATDPSVVIDPAGAGPTIWFNCRLCSPPGAYLPASPAAMRLLTPP